MKLNEYQGLAQKTSEFEKLDLNNLLYLVVCIAGETGEIAEKVKKIIRE